MKLGQSLKTGLLASAALAASLAAHPLAAAESARAPTEIVAVPAAPQAPVVADETAIPVGRLAGLAAIAAAIAAAFNWKRLVRVAKRAAPAAKAAASAVAAAPVAVAKAVSSATTKPFRWILAILSLSLFSLLGFGMYDVEWAAGAVAGVAAVLLIWISSAKLSRVALRARAESRRR